MVSHVCYVTQTFEKEAFIPVGIRCFNLYRDVELEKKEEKIMNLEQNIRRIGERVRRSTWNNWLLLLFILLVPCTAMLRSTDYVNADADAGAQAGISVTAEHPVSADVRSSDKNLRSVLLHVGAPSDYRDGESDLELVLTDEEGNVVASRTLVSTEEAEGTDNSSAPVELELQNIIPDSKGKTYTLRASSNAANADEAFSLAVFENSVEQEIWYRCTYRFLSSSRRFVVVTLIGWLLLIICNGILGKWSGPYRPERLFLIASVILGILYFFVVPCMIVPDAANHFVRTYLLTKGVLVLPAGGMVNIPKNLLPYANYTYTPYIVGHHLTEQVDWSREISYNAVNMALYSPLNYLPQAAGMALTEVFSQNPQVLQIGGSVASYIVCTGILYRAIRRIPYGKNTLALLALLPINLQERASLSADTLSFACVAALMAFCLEQREEHKLFTWREYFEMYALLITAASCKIVYFFAGMLILAIPACAFGNRKKEALHRGLGLTVLLGMAGGWTAFATGYLGNTRGGGDTAYKVNLILHQPLRYLYILNKTIMTDGVQYLFEALGSKMGSTNIAISQFVIFVALIFLLHAVFTERREMKLQKRQDWVLAFYLLILALGMILLVMTSLYIQWTSVSAADYSIEGLQGRYFAPILPFLLFGYLSYGQREKQERVSSCNSSKAIFAMCAVNLLVLIICWGYSSYVG